MGLVVTFGHERISVSSMADQWRISSLIARSLGRGRPLRVFVLPDWAAAFFTMAFPQSAARQALARDRGAETAASAPSATALARGWRPGRVRAAAALRASRQ